MKDKKYVNSEALTFQKTHICISGRIFALVEGIKSVRP